MNFEPVEQEHRGNISLPSYANGFVESDCGIQLSLWIWILSLKTLALLVKSCFQGHCQESWSYKCGAAIPPVQVCLSLSEKGSRENANNAQGCWKKILAKSHTQPVTKSLSCLVRASLSGHKQVLNWDRIIKGRGCWVSSDRSRWVVASGFTLTSFTSA